MKYDKETKDRWGSTVAYKEFEEKRCKYSNDKFESINKGLETILKEFSDCLMENLDPSSKQAQDLVNKLKEYITNYYYTCSNEILYGLGQMYVSDERFKNNIDKNGIGTAEYISKAISIYCGK